MLPAVNAPPMPRPMPRASRHTPLPAAALCLMPARHAAARGVARRTPQYVAFC